MFEAAGTIYAHWTQKPVTNPDDTRKEYAIWIAPDIRHGDVYVNYQYAEPGTRVTVIVPVSERKAVYLHHARL